MRGNCYEAAAKLLHAHRGCVREGRGAVHLSGVPGVWKPGRSVVLRRRLRPRSGEVTRAGGEPARGDGQVGGQLGVLDHVLVALAFRVDQFAGDLLQARRRLRRPKPCVLLVAVKALLVGLVKQAVSLPDQASPKSLVQPCDACSPLVGKPRARSSLFAQPSLHQLRLEADQVPELDRGKTRVA